MVEADLLEQLATATEMAASLSSELAGRDEIVSDLENSVRGMHEKLLSIEEELGHTAQALQQTLAEKDALEVRLTSEMSHIEETFKAQMAKVLEDRDATITELQEGLVNTKGSLSSECDTRARLERQVTWLETELAGARRHADTVETKALESSKTIIIHVNE